MLKVPSPTFRLTLEGRDLSPRFLPRLHRLELTDYRGLEADALTIDLDDTQGDLMLPARGVRLALALGLSGALFDRGSYLVQEIEHSGTPDRLTLRARAADLAGGELTRKRTASFDNTTVGAILETIAARHALTLRAAPDLASRPVPHLDQTAESDANLLARLAQEHDAVATIKAEALLFLPAGGGTTAGGLALAPVLLTRGDGERHRYTLTERDAFDGVIAQWRDPDSAQTQEAAAGGTDNPKRLRTLYATATDAQRAAESEWQRIQRGGAEFELSLATARLDIGPETPVTLAGWKRQIDATAWICTEARHTLTPTAGLSTWIKLEARIP